MQLFDSPFETRYRQLRESGQRGWFGYGIQREHIEQFIARMEKLQVFRGAEVLVQGCGAGETAEFLAQYGLNVTGVDLSPTAIEIARTYSEQLPNLRFEHASITDLSIFHNDSFDVIVDDHCLHHICPPDRDVALHETARILRPGGHYLVATSVGIPEPADHQLLGYNPETRTLRQDGVDVNYCATTGEVLGELAKSGFRVLRWNEKGGESKILIADALRIPGQ